MQDEKSCPDCRMPDILIGGDGRCKYCWGEGEQFTDNWSNNLTDALTGSYGDDVCDVCSGTGQCQSCGGTGYIYVSENNEDNEYDSYDTYDSVGYSGDYSGSYSDSGSIISYWGCVGILIGGVFIAFISYLVYEYNTKSQIRYKSNYPITNTVKKPPKVYHGSFYKSFDNGRNISLTKDIENGIRSTLQELSQYSDNFEILSYDYLNQVEAARWRGRTVLSWANRSNLDGTVSFVRGKWPQDYKYRSNTIIIRSIGLKKDPINSSGAEKTNSLNLLKVNVPKIPNHSSFEFSFEDFPMNLQLMKREESIAVESSEPLRAIINFLLLNPDTTIMLIGHTDSVGDYKINEKLSSLIVLEVKNAIVQGGLSKNRITTKYFGESSPVAWNNTKEGQKKNNRLTIIIN